MSIRHPIHWIGDKPADHFASIPNELARDGELSSAARSVAMLFWSHAEDWEVSQTSVAAALGLDRGTAGRALNELDAARWLAIRRPRWNSWEFFAHPARKLTEAEHAEFSRNQTCGENLRGDAGNSSKGMRKNTPTTMREISATKKTIQEHQEEKQQERSGVDVEHDDAKTEEEQCYCRCCRLPYFLCEHYVSPKAKLPSAAEEPPF